MNEVNRRDFLKTAAIAGSGLIFAPNVLKAQSKNANSKLNIALIGFGAQGKVLFQSIMKLPNLNFRAVCDLRPQMRKYVRLVVKKEWKQDVAEYDDYREMIAKEKDLDGVFIATPDFWHSPMTCDCLEAGINVYCEKMMSNTKEGARKMVKTMQKTGKLLQIGHQRKSNPRYQYVHDVLLNQRSLCGTLTNANGQWNRAVTLDITCAPSVTLPEDVLKKWGYKDMHQFLNWRWYKGLGCGPISDLGAHQIDIFAWFFGGRPKSVLAGGGVDFYPNKDWYDNVMCIFEYETYQKRNARAFYQVLTTTAAGGYYEQFMGTEGTIKMSENPGLTKIYKENSVPDEKWKKLIDEGVLEMGAAPAAPATVQDARESKPPAEYAMPKSISFTKPIHMLHIENFLGAIRGENKLTCDAEHAFEAEAAVFKAVEAIEAKKMLYFEESDFVA